MENVLGGGKREKVKGESLGNGKWGTGNGFLVKE